VKNDVLQITEISWESSNQLLNLIRFLRALEKNVKIKKNLTYLAKTVDEELIGIEGNTVPNEVTNKVN
jgi:uncharacterized protein YihD (DUF1040 family)